MLLTAHYDGVGDHPGLRQPAACGQRVSGVAVVLEAARVLAPHLPAGLGLSVALLDAEEVGALGSAHHAAQLAYARARLWSSTSTAPADLHRPPRSRPAGPRTGCSPPSTRPAGTPAYRSRAGPIASDNRRYAAAGLAAVGIGAGHGRLPQPGRHPRPCRPGHPLAAIARWSSPPSGTSPTADATVSSLIGDRR